MKEHKIEIDSDTLAQTTCPIEAFLPEGAVLLQIEEGARCTVTYRMKEDRA